ncbi:hypothetical protein CcaverHIS002_0503640 [Cutaneotrichosporon cavernicola]|uniref:rRNA biogenesis protein RRP36 n=1 Tax=Cutaneotrichosporon cavernicola TaxID=279322 RepID=A0AA48QWX0_9TREE|nr:uncharacterized protein CcaverHIS019_0504210 [Cutaneotrichosporon cavernicola]BEI84963.1 hypothetical protein CcaverHIS002_0503640 [Cutaneotrichosporon cavernicola]BEI92793.1 hypothetical protein CcaverHIS019_0504210 [Cutaneotrichosporon cavernicola]BEJ00569.1 hypothetical protein CcaverHIS631_0504260 [Cutaneotrichosporon cavernicola]BEJ08337.1 hypothetical protein CcaverHIS641_0504220 [Cutaneotrichosporon cavernicola]
MPRKPALKRPPPKFADDDDILDPDSEEDEFTDYVATSRRPAASSEDDDEGSDGSDAEFDSEDEGDGVGMYEADEWDAADSDSDSEPEDEDTTKLRKLKKGLDDIPLDTLMRVQARMGVASTQPVGREEKLAKAKAKLAAMQRAKGKALGVEDEEAPRRKKRFESESENESDEDLSRSNKHAPVAMSSKKQVSRRRGVIDVPRAERRDPRFSSISAEKANADVHAKRYAFVPELLDAEVKSLYTQVVAAKKAEKACKLVDKPRFTEAREEIERELAQVRTRLDRARTEQREREVLAKLRGEENARRKEGKGAWYLKKSEKKDLLLQARFEAIEKKGGARAVKKVVEKKRKKVAGKEKKSRPFKAGGFAEGGSGEKRRRVG